MSLDPGDVVWHDAPFKPPRSDGTSPDRPWLVVSNASHPFHGEEYVVLGMTTNPRSEGVRVTDADQTTRQAEPENSTAGVDGIVTRCSPDRLRSNEFSLGDWTG